MTIKDALKEIDAPDGILFMYRMPVPAPETEVSLALNTFHKYATYIWEGEPCSVFFLSEKTGTEEQKIKKDIMSLRNSGLFPKGTHFNDEHTTIYFS